MARESGKRIIQDTEWVHLHPKLVQQELATDMLGKTGAQKHDSGGMRDRNIRTGNLYGCTEIHFIAFSIQK